MPYAEDIDLEGLDISRETVRNILEVDNGLWKQELAGIQEFYGKFESLPQELTEQLDILKSNLN